MSRGFVLDEVLAWLRNFPLVTAPAPATIGRRRLLCSRVERRRPITEINMKRVRFKPVSRLYTVLASLLFLFGNNYCIVSAYASSSASRAGLMCHEAPLSASASKASAKSCCGNNAAGHQRNHPVQAPGSPCCMGLAEVSVPVVAKDLCVTPVPFACAETAPVAMSGPARIPSHPPRTDLRARPLASPAKGPLALRAPPRI